MESADGESMDWKNFAKIGKKIVCVGRNYTEHAKELGNKVPTEPVIFLKPSSSFITKGQQIELPKGTKEIHHEVELGVIIGKGGKCISQSTALSHVAGYCLALDMTDRNLQEQLKSKGLPWTLAKGFDTSCPVSDFIPFDKIPDPQEIQLWLEVNGEMRQNGNTKNMLFSTSFLLSWISQYMAFEEGDVLLTGTPSGVGPVTSGDVIKCGLGDIMEMSFTVK